MDAVAIAAAATAGVRNTRVGRVNILPVVDAVSDGLKCDLQAFKLPLPHTVVADSTGALRLADERKGRREEASVRLVA